MSVSGALLECGCDGRAKRVLVGHEAGAFESPLRGAIFEYSLWLAGVSCLAIAMRVRDVSAAATTSAPSRGRFVCAKGVRLPGVRDKAGASQKPWKPSLTYLETQASRVEASDHCWLCSRRRRSAPFEADLATLRTRL